jgi:hypothetical protein
MAPRLPDLQDGDSGDLGGDLLGVNEWHGSQYWSLVQLMGLVRSYEVSAGRRGCCTYLLYLYPVCCTST